MKKYKIFLTIGILLLLAGLGIAAYPHISNSFYRSEIRKDIERYDDMVSRMYSDTDTEDIGREIERIKTDNPDTDYTVSDYIEDHGLKAPDDPQKLDWAFVSLLREQMEQYNSQLIEDGQNGLNDPFLFEQPSFLLTTYGFPDNVFGHISAPSIDMELPVYLGANQYNMNFGAVHLSQSSMPIGGENTNSVFAAHRGYIGKIFFDNIVYLSKGDDIYITNPWGELRYKVIETEIISPYDIERCYIREGRDLITLLTCHPYGSNEYRYMVVAERAE